MTFKRYDTSDNTYYSESYIGENGTITWNDTQGLRLHDGSTPGGNPIGSSSIGNLSVSGNSISTVNNGNVIIGTDLQVTSSISYLNSSNVVAAYTFYNPITNSIDTIFP